MSTATATKTDHDAAIAAKINSLWNKLQEHSLAVYRQIREQMLMVKPKWGQRSWEQWATQYDMPKGWTYDRVIRWMRVAEYWELAELAQVRNLKSALWQPCGASKTVSTVSTRPT